MAAEDKGFLAELANSMGSLERISTGAVKMAGDYRAIANGSVVVPTSATPAIQAVPGGKAPSSVEVVNSGTAVTDEENPFMGWVTNNPILAGIGAAVFLLLGLIGVRFALK